jgi:hypothetical protein
MRKIFNIVILVLVYLLFSGRSCDNRPPDEEARAQALVTTRDSIREAFETDWLSESAMYAHEVTARQKLSDLADYMHMLADTTLDSAFRQKAGEMIRKMFMTAEARVSVMLRGDRRVRAMPLSEVLREAWTRPGILAPFRFDSILVKEPLHRVDVTRYAGTLAFRQRFTGPAPPDTTMTVSRHKVVDFFAVREEKLFGKDTLRVWEVVLGDFR